MKKPRIDGTVFGSITIDGAVFKHDVVIGTDGAVKERKKELSRGVFGGSHTISLHEAKYVFEQGEHADRLIVGSGQYGKAELSPEATAFAEGRRCSVLVLPTPEAIVAWNSAEDNPIGLFHVTC
jgi:hypothetical protein